ncbi:hypothetical protein BGZ95_005066 [Linnemannia exigua]|uniref:PLC-like phosphodiesterase n=1 Tax=Linnemannia exigua TaxID=604196 RepID=A0AAD4D3Z3_9FUNG|nr:hypothetical protein BGZ95_005066 [Linnemannia exigua]
MTALTTFWLTLALVVLLFFGWAPPPGVVAASESGYRGALPQIPDRPIRMLPRSESRVREQSMGGGERFQRLSDTQDPSRWNTECLMQRQPAASSGDWTNSQPSTGHLQKRNSGERERARSSRRSVAGDKATVPAGSSPVYSLAVVNSTDMLCNGRSDICDLRYNQVTYPATHNSAAYDLKYDCQLSTQSCLKKETVCQAQAQNCTMGWEVRCTKISNTCIDRLPGWLHWLCGAFTSACQSTETVCLGWEQICTNSLEVCLLWGSACLEVIPNWAMPCLWENQPGHSIAQQLSDGIRFLDLGTCLSNNDTDIVMCHGNGITRAIGIPLDTVLSQILTFILANPYEVLTIEFNENDGDVAALSRIIVAKLLKYFTIPGTGLLFWPRSSMTEKWPTLREMILANKRIMVFMGDTYYPIPDPKPNWANQKDTWKMDGFRYTSDDTMPKQLNESYYGWCGKGAPTDGSFIQWQQIDINMGILAPDIINELKQGKVPQLCIGPLATETNYAFLEAIADFCYTRWPYWFRVRVNNYWDSDVFKIASHFNDMNVARVKAGSGNQITPY